MFSEKKLESWVKKERLLQLKENPVDLFFMHLNKMNKGEEMVQTQSAITAARLATLKQDVLRL